MTSIIVLILCLMKRSVHSGWRKSLNSSSRSESSICILQRNGCSKMSITFPPAKLVWCISRNIHVAIATTQPNNNIIIIIMKWWIWLKIAAHMLMLLPNTGAIRVIDPVLHELCTRENLLQLRNPIVDAVDRFYGSTNVTMQLNETERIIYGKMNKRLC